ncbi:vacuolar protein-sorting-associated protein 25-like [Dysidea avara]|uniref:vacuolar protein-sorting-associated protein 25-like n=1 Tax=Dysidea avara TaxID=196820 RepID=UPI00332FED9F
MSSFEWPWQYSFEPFFTIQPNPDTREKQLDAWCDLVLAYCKYTREYVLDVKTVATSTLFNNDQIKRRLSIEGVQAVLERLELKGHLEWQDSSKSRCLVMWRTPEEWANIIYHWAQDSGLGDSVCTLYEIHSGEENESQEFHGIDIWMLKRVVAVLQRQGKAELIAGMAPDDSDSGVKFF